MKIHSMRVYLYFYIKNKNTRNPIQRLMNLKDESHHILAKAPIKIRATLCMDGPYPSPNLHVIKYAHNIKEVRFCSLCLTRYIQSIFLKHRS